VRRDLTEKPSQFLAGHSPARETSLIQERCIAQWRYIRTKPFTFPHSGDRSDETTGQFLARRRLPGRDGSAFSQRGRISSRLRKTGRSGQLESKSGAGSACDLHHQRGGAAKLQTCTILTGRKHRPHGCGVGPPDSGLPGTPRRGMSSSFILQPPNGSETRSAGAAGWHPLQFDRGDEHNIMAFHPLIWARGPRDHQPRVITSGCGCRLQPFFSV